MTQTVSTESPMELSSRERLIQIMKREQALFIRQTLSQKPMSVDDIAELSQIPVRRVLSALTVLEIEELVRQESGSRYTLRAVLTE